ncbi:MAG TPA: hypothetical protein VGV61_11030 [Thermoanaerobaculia bacterium]|nr:hypothetical protein [Thermoanaerobaculia bacterium]
MRCTCRLALAVVWPLVALVAPPAGAVVRSMFITSDALSVPGSLGTADAICQARATTAGLSDPQDYRAWLSTSTTDAYCHVQDLAGKRANNCGQASLPTAAGPWQQVDGHNFGADIVHLLAPDRQVYLPPTVDENGDEVHDLVWTGTDENGVAGDTCLDWTTSSGTQYAIVGYSPATGSKWTDLQSSSCSGARHLLCFQVGAGDPLPSVCHWGRLAFVSSQVGPGDFSMWAASGGQTGLAGGNTICRTLAAAAGLANVDSFKAWLSNGGNDAKDRFTDGPWIRLDRIRFAPDLAALTGGLGTYVNAPLNLTETGQYLGDVSAWTATDHDGTLNTPFGHCNNWSDMSDYSTVGDSEYTSSLWTYNESGIGISCGLDQHLYCLQDLPLIFGDGFECGSTDTWSWVVP